MSHPHPTLSAWTRDDHDGHYAAELHDWKLEVRWSPNKPNTPNEPGARGAFGWKAERDDNEHKGEQRFEEMEHAMVAAEAFSAADAQRRSAQLLATKRGDDDEEA